MMADDIPVAHTPPGGYGDEFPPPILAGCTEPLVAEAPDLRGTWKESSRPPVGVRRCRKAMRYSGTPSASNSDRAATGRRARHRGHPAA